MRYSQQRERRSQVSIVFRPARIHPVFHYAIAVVAAAGAFEIELWLRQSALDRDLFVLSYGAVLISAWLGGLGPGFLAIGVSSALTFVLLLSPAYSVSVELDDFLRIGIFIFIALLTSSLVNGERRALARAEEALLTRSNLMAELSHDLKGPLTVIKSTAELLQRQLARSGPASTGFANRLETIERASARIAEQIDELLDAARLDAGQALDLNRAPMDLVALVESLVEEHCDEPSGCTIHVDHAGMSELVGAWDEARVSRVVDNLLSNAIKYSPHGADIAVRLRSEDGWAILEVEDHGIGIARRDLPHVFERFWRGTNAALAASGAGVGLASARDVVELHGGRIAVESAEGAGSTFTVSLPLSAHPPGEAAGSLTA